MRISKRSDAKLQANRLNAQRSTGPKTAAGKIVSSQNALRHGLSRPVKSSSQQAQKADALAEMLLHGEVVSESHAANLAVALVDIERISEVRKQIFQNLYNSASEFEYHPELELAALRAGISDLLRTEQYLRKGRSRLKKVMQVFES